MAKDDPLLLGQIARLHVLVEIAAVTQQFARRPDGLRAQVGLLGVDGVEEQAQLVGQAWWIFALFFLFKGVVVLGIAMVKVRFVGLDFMELRNAPIPFRAIFELYCVALFLVLAGMYLWL